MIEIRRLGRIDYADALALQRSIHRDIREGRAPATILLLEHPRVITVGRRADRTHVLNPGDIPVLTTDRGGDVTYHGPGQLVAYGLVDLHRAGLAAKDYVTRLEEVMIRLCGAYGVEAGRRAGLTGAWVGDEKIGAIGVRIEHWITLHGFAFNVDPDLSDFARIVPCGIADRGVTSLGKLLGRPVPMGEVLEHAEPLLRKLMAKVS
jgi:lipoate-protein ligase B